MFKNILKLVSTIISPVTDMIDDVVTTDEERLKLKNKLKEIENNLAIAVMEHEQEVIKSKKDVMVAELEQDDKYTKRARPTVVYGGLAVILLKHILVPFITELAGINFPDIAIPSEFWLAWGGVTGVYSFRRTQEKLEKTKLEEKK
ncbi:MAG: holin family protein [Candidatus Cloacimonetes bacterium]|nr:holin family protein [Candidatus Cloacimonadota bacterium]